MTTLAQQLKSRLEEIVSFYGVNADAQVQEIEGAIELAIPASPATPRLIGYHGETLRAIEQIMNQIAKRLTEEAPRVNVDVADYQRARRHALEELARSTAAQVIASKEPLALAPMNPAERRLVHMALREIDGIETESQGDGRGRRIIVKPQREA